MEEMDDWESEGVNVGNKANHGTACVWIKQKATPPSLYERAQRRVEVRA
jgi:hypothetical protein